MAIPSRTRTETLQDSQIQTALNIQTEALTLSELIYTVFKRLLDLAGSLTLVILFLPVWIIIPILIKLDSPGPIIFRHRRVGKNGKEFEMLKFRSMIDGAHEYLHRQNPELLEKFKAADWKLENDPRITRLGKVLRSITIDEFPQIFNVLRGDMSIIGPRAYMKQEITEQTKKYPETTAMMQLVLSIKPGITGPWQTSGRNEIPFDKRVSIDAAYARQKSILQDLLIIFKTPRAMFSKW